MKDRILYMPRDQKIYSSRSRRPRRLLPYILLCGMIILAAAGVFVIRLPSLQARSVTIEGIVSLDESDIRSVVLSSLQGSYAFVFPRSFLFFVSGAALTGTLTHAYPLIAAVQIEKIMPDALRIIIRERELFGILCNQVKSPEGASEKDPECAYLDTEGVAYEHAPNSTGFLINRIYTDFSTLNVGAQIVDVKIVQLMSRLKHDTERITKSRVTGFTLFKKIPDEIHLSVDGFTLMYKREDDYSRPLNALVAVLKEIGAKRSRLQYIDLRFGNKVFYKFK